MRWLYLLLAVLAAAVALQAGLLVFALYVLIGVLLLSRYLTKQWVGSLEALRDLGDVDELEAGQSCEVKIKVRNTGDWTVAWILMEDILPESAIRQKPPRVRLKGKRLKIGTVRAGKTLVMKYTIHFDYRGYYQIGPTVLETGDLFGLHRRHRIVTKPAYVLVYPKVIPLPKYDFSSQRPIGEVNLAHMLFEDPTRNAGVRPYQVGDPLQRVHWRATARAGQLMCRIYEPTTLAGASLLIDFHIDGYPKRGEPFRSELAVTTAASLAYGLSLIHQQVGLFSNGKDAADRIRLEIPIQQGSEETPAGFVTRDEVRETTEMLSESDRLRPLVVETRRGIEQFQRIREALARLEFGDGMSFPRLVLEVTPRLPRDATVLAILPTVPVETSTMLGNLRRQGFAVSVILIGMDEESRAVGQGRLLSAGIRDVRAINSEEELGLLGEVKVETTIANPYEIDRDLT